MLTPEQIEKRRLGVCASEIAAVAGLHPYQSIFDVWSSKLGLSNFNGNEQTAWGNLMESPLCDWAAQKLGLVIETSDTLIHSAEPLIIATPDRLCRETAESKVFAVLEAKNTGPNTRKDYFDPDERPDGIPFYVLAQVTFQMAVTGLSQAFVVANIGQSTPAIYRTEFDVNLFGALVEKAKRFWRYVESQVPPPVDDRNARAATEWMREHCRQKSDELIEAPAELKYLAHKYEQARIEKKEADKRMVEAKAKIQEAIGDSAGIMGEGWKATWKESNGSVNWKAVASELGASDDLIEKHTGKGSRRFVLKYQEVENV